jgi:hypothetical protein
VAVTSDAAFPGPALPLLDLNDIAGVADIVNCARVPWTKLTGADML